MDIKCFESGESIREVAKKLCFEREARGEETGMCAYLQPPEMPTLDELVRDRIDVCWPYVIGDSVIRKVKKNMSIGGAKER